MSDWWNPFSWGSRDPSIMTKTLTDPLKENVANPMSAYLGSQVGQGIGSPGMDPAYTARYNDFMGANANDIYDKNVYAPQLKLYNEQKAPLIDEQYAGNLRGSGHYTAANEGMSNFQAQMGAGRYQANLAFPEAQLAAGNAYNKQAYDEWSAGLPQNNPALKQGLEFLNNATGTGTTILSAMDPGQEGWLKDLLVAGLGGNPAPSGNSAGSVNSGASGSSSMNYEDTASGFSGLSSSLSL